VTAGKHPASSLLQYQVIPSCDSKQGSDTSRTVAEQSATESESIKDKRQVTTGDDTPADNRHSISRSLRSSQTDRRACLPSRTDTRSVKPF